jgi:hypothetical protein
MKFFEDSKEFSLLGILLIEKTGSKKRVVYFDGL